MEIERRYGTPPESSKSTPPSSSTIDVNIPKAIGETIFTELGSPIASLTPLQSAFGLPQMGAIYVSDLTPISRDEIPPFDYFSAKRGRILYRKPSTGKTFLIFIISNFTIHHTIYTMFLGIP
jgi:hypothetical protein